MLHLDDDYPEILGIIARAVYDFLVGLNIPVDCASAHALVISERIRTEIGGAAPYIPKGTKYLSSRRDAEIYERFDVTNYATLAREFYVTEMRIRQIIQAARATEIKRRQSDLF